ncbi:Piso0_004978 [Millerozyma farinosa CBS 7064]|uniref:Piso0_004978 protein n=1 Tax=Pichia sorbitophila (strain ATCC MYA-4447 / BCRC 22081 / CBS 7064 / NBRC 10061 / NRRL Y-12695) TaxID=559304 RepID=G8Y0Y2_PICSO|nr:Piso0_004978 [Millerozyma farinosa CBS 7064]
MRRKKSGPLDAIRMTLWKSTYRQVERPTLSKTNVATFVMGLKNAPKKSSMKRLRIPMHGTAAPTYNQTVVYASSYQRYSYEYTSSAFLR